MQRGDSRHGPMLDDQMADETRNMKAGASSREDGWRDPEIPVEDEPGGQTASSPLQSSAPVGMTADDVEGRFRLARYLETGRFPADADEIREMAKEANAPDTVMMELMRLPEGRYESVTEAWKAMGHGVETSRLDIE